MKDSTTRVAILGGGMASLACAYRLSSPSSPRRFDVTVYQMGWRLGGKGASGRNQACADRIEEHGLHVWMGFYQEAFALIREVYGDLQRLGLRTPKEPLATWEQAFTPHDLIVVAEAVKEGWAFWRFPFPTNEEKPGDPGLSVWPRFDSYAQMARKLIERGLKRVPGNCRAGSERWSRRASRLLATMLSKNPAVRAALLDHEHGLRRWLTFLEFLHVNVRGVLTDLVLGGASLDDLDALDYREWLERHGASKLLLESGGLRGMYDMSFAYEEGDSERPDFAAGVFLRFFARMFLGYKGAVFWKMQGGMGDVVFTPLYQVLRARGVRFEFFHRVDELRVGALGATSNQGGRVIEEIALTRQADVRGDCYEPLVDVGGLPCWPSEPLWAQLREADARKRDGSLESANTAGADRKVTLKRGRDFDEVVLGISIGGLPRIGRDLARHNPAFDAMCRGVKTTATQAAQLWFDRPASALGWPAEPCVLDAYGGAMNTWADMTHLAPRESWPPGRVGHIAYFCGPFKPEPYACPDAPKDSELARDAIHAREAFRGAANRDLGGLWPHATSDEGALRWDWLVAPPGTRGEARLQHQYVRANTEPTDRYVLSARGSTQYRLRPHETGFRNLVFAGDWTRTSLNYGCIEAATQSGVEAAEVLETRASRQSGAVVIELARRPVSVEREAS